jgi:hypothetical protein
VKNFSKTGDWWLAAGGFIKAPFLLRRMQNHPLSLSMPFTFTLLLSSPFLKSNVFFAVFVFIIASEGLPHR